MTTKEHIVDEALSLFSIKGYKGISVKNIADASALLPLHCRENGKESS